MAITIQNFHRKLRAGTSYTVHCPGADCPRPVTALSEFGKHVQAYHGKDLMTQCPFCDHSWTRGQKSREAVHLNACLDRFVRENKIRNLRLRGRVARAPPPAKQPPTVPVTDACLNWVPQPREMILRPRHSDWTGFYDPVFEEPTEFWNECRVGDPPPLPLDGGGVSEVYEILSRFDGLGSGFQWWHIVVRAATFPLFLETFRDLKSSFMLLPHWCLCDGRKEGGRLLCDELLHHRHMIAVWDAESDFENRWNKRLRIREVKFAKVHKKIKSVKHLIAVIDYVSQSRASCDGSVKGGLDTRHYSHYYLNRPVYPHAFVAMSVLIQNGLEEAIRFRLIGKSVYGWKDHCRQTRDRQNNVRYSIPIGETFVGEMRDCVLPVRRDLEPDGQIHEGPPAEGPFAWLWDNRTMGFRSNPALLSLSREEWYKHQVERMNAFLNVVEKEQYHLTRGQVSLMKGIMEEKQTFERRLREKDVEVERRLKDCKVERDEYWEARLRASEERERQLLHQTIERMNQFLQQKDRDLQQKDRDLQQKDRDLQQKDRDLQQKDLEVGLLRKEIADLRYKLDHFRDDEITRLREELREAKETIQKLNAKLEHLNTVDMKRLKDDLSKAHEVIDRLLGERNKGKKRHASM